MFNVVEIFNNYKQIIQLVINIWQYYPKLVQNRPRNRQRIICNCKASNRQIIPLEIRYKNIPQICTIRPSKDEKCKKGDPNIKKNRPLEHNKNALCNRRQVKCTTKPT